MRLAVEVDARLGDTVVAGTERLQMMMRQAFQRPRLDWTAALRSEDLCKALVVEKRRIAERHKACFYSYSCSNRLAVVVQRTEVKVVVALGCCLAPDFAWHHHSVVVV